jgi:hypothetical protein
MKKLASSSGTVVYESDNKLYITKKPAQWTTTFLFVTGLLALILLGNGVLQLFIVDEAYRISQNFGLILLGGGVLCLLIFWGIAAYRKKVNAKPVTELKHLCIIDLTSQTLLDGNQNMLAPLAAVRLVRKMQITSSSPELLLTWNTRSLTIVKGNPFSGGVGSVEKVLKAKGISTK